MKRKVRIVALPKARQGGYVNPIPGAHPGYNGAYGPPDSYYPSDNGTEESTEVNKTLKPTSRKHANLEAEKGETVITNLSQGGIPEFYTIGGKRHYDGGTPLNLPEDSFIFSRDNKLKIKDKDILNQYGITNAKKGGVSPADISKKYDINKYRKILADPSSDKYQRETAEMMIQNYNYKLGGLAMVQESMKGFPNGVPGVAAPYLEQNGIDPSELISNMFPEQGDQMPTARYGGQNYFQSGGRYNTPDIVKMNTDSVVITPGTQNINANRLIPRSTDLTKKYDWSKTYTPSYDPTGTKMAASDALDKRKADLNTQLLDIRRNMAKTYNLPTNKEGLPDYTQMDPNVILDKSKMDPAMLKNMYDIMYEKRAIRDAQGFKRKQFYGDTEAEQMGYNENTPLEDLNLGIRFATGVQSEQLNELKNKDNQLASLTLKQYGGDTTGKRKVKVTLPEYKDAGAVAMANKPTRWQNVPKDKVRWDITKPGYDEAKVMAGDYVKDEDGKWYQVTGRSVKNDPFTGELFDDPNLVSDKVDFREDYSRLKQRIDSSPELQEAIINKYKEYAKDLKARKNLTQADVDQIKSLADNPQAILDNFYKAQKQFLAINAQVATAIDLGKNWDEGTAQQLYRTTAEKLGYTPLNNAEAGAFQTTFWALKDLEKDSKFKPLLRDFQFGAIGVADEGKNSKDAAVSAIDGYVGNTTVGQLGLYKPTATELQKKEAEWKEAAKEMSNIKHLQDPAYAGETPFWTQDLVNFGQAVMNRYTIPRFEPYEAKAPVRLPRATFMDPMQQVQNILASEANALDVAGTFATPGGYAATAGMLHGQSANAVANAIANVHNQNVQIANEFELRRNDILNRASDRDAQLATRLHDKYNILNQQLANSKKQASTEIWKHFNNMWTNRGMTQTMNEMYDQYNVDPITGYTYMGPGRDLTPKDISNKDIATAANDLMSSVPGLTADKAMEYAAKSLGYSPTKGTGMDPRQFGYPGGMPYGYFPEG